MEYTEHHIWCNYFNRSVEECKQCKQLYELYPLDFLSAEEALEKYFPEVYEMNKNKFNDTD